MSSPRLFKTEEQQRDDQIRKTIRSVESYFLRNRKKMTKECLSPLLPQLESQLDPNNHSHAQYLSLILFLELCCKYKDLLPEDFSQFKNSEILFDRFSSLKNSIWFRNSSSLDKGFINLQLEKNKPQLTTEMHPEESKEKSNNNF